MAKSLSECSREELIEIINSLKRQKKFGLVWEDKPEKVAEDCKLKLPVLEEIKEKKIEFNKNEPTNLIIEGDNYHALSVLNYTHAGKIDVIYIDPPYNTGNKDFVYNDRFVDKEDAFSHSKWLSFMDKRLRLAKNLLSDDGVIFISIDDNEQAHLKMLSDEIFGRENCIDTIIWKKTENIKMDSKFLSQNKDFILVYRKSSSVQFFLKEASTVDRFKLEDDKGKYYLRKLDSLSSSYSRGMDYVIEHKGISYYPGGSKEKWEKRQQGEHGSKAPTWLWSKQKYEEGLKEGEIVFKNGNVYNKVRYDGEAKKPYINIQNLVSQQTGQKELDAIFNGKRVFDHPKPTGVIEWLIKLVPGNESSTILDFFAGSGTTGHSVLDLNAQDGGHRQFILCTNNENKIAEEVTYPRVKTVITGIRTDGSKYSEGIPANLRYFKTDFVEKDRSTDATREKLVARSADMIRIRENAYEELESESINKYYESKNSFVAVIFDPFEMEKAWQEIEKLNVEKKFVKLYIFSYSRDTSAFTEEIPETELEWEAVPIPESILQVYKRLFGGKK